MTTYELYNLGELHLESGVTLSSAQLAYKTYGIPNPQRTNAVLLCSFINGTHEGYEYLIGEGRCLDPQRFFIIGTNLFGNGLSSSPSNTPFALTSIFYWRMQRRRRVTFGMDSSCRSNRSGDTGQAPESMSPTATSSTLLSRSCLLREGAKLAAPMRQP